MTSRTSIMGAMAAAASAVASAPRHPLDCLRGHLTIKTSKSKNCSGLWDRDGQCIWVEMDDFTIASKPTFFLIFSGKCGVLSISLLCTVIENYSKCLISFLNLCIFNNFYSIKIDQSGKTFLAFSSNSCSFKLTCLVTLFNRKLHLLKNSPKSTIIGIFD